MRIFIPILLLWITPLVNAQDSLLIDQRSFLNMVMQNSPYIQAKRLANDIAVQRLAESRAVFQPTLQGLYERKRFDDKLYYSRMRSEIKVQTPAALQLSGGLNTSAGNYLNPEATLPAAGLSFVSVELPLGAGLLTDKTRTQVTLERLNLSATEMEVHLAINKYLFEAGKIYWKWYESVILQRLALEAVQVTDQRFDFVKAKQSVGEFASIDTLEAFINLQNRQAFYNEQRIALQRYSRELSTLIAVSDELWMAPVIDPDIDVFTVDSSASRDILSSHPMSRLFSIDQMSYAAKERLAREYFKPEVNVKYSMQQNASEPFVTSYDFNDNQYVGLQVKFPLFLRSERARAKQWAAKQEMVANELEYFNIELINALTANEAMRVTLDSNQLLWRANASNYARLLSAEQQRFFLGESTNFMVNRRESQWLETRKKYIKSYVEFRIRTLEYYYLMAVLPNVIGND